MENRKVGKEMKRKGDDGSGEARPRKQPKLHPLVALDIDGGWTAWYPFHFLFQSPPNGNQRATDQGSSTDGGLSSASDPAPAADANRAHSTTAGPLVVRAVPQNAGPGGFNLFRDVFGMSGDDEMPPERNDPGLTFCSCGGLEEQITYIRTHLMFLLANKVQVSEWGVDPVKGIIFHGPPGSGKTLLAKALANELGRMEGQNFSFFMRNGTDMFGKYVGQTESAIRSLFDSAKANKPSIIFLDEIDGLASSREEASTNGKFYNGVVTQLLACMDQVVRGEVIVIGATNRLDAIDPAFRRPGRFDKALQFHLPKVNARVDILKIHTGKWKNKPPASDYEEVGALTVGYTGADLEQLCREVFMVALYRQFPNPNPGALCVNLDSLKILPCDWRQAIANCVKSKSNVFGNYVYNGEIVHPEIRLLTAGVEDELKSRMANWLRQPTCSEAEIGTGIKSCLVWSKNERTTEAVNSFVIPSFISGCDTSSSITFKFDSRLLHPQNRIDEFMDKVLEIKKNTILFIPNLDKLLVSAGEFRLDKLLATQLNSIRGKNVVLLATASSEIETFPEAFHQLFYGIDRTFLIRAITGEEAHKFFQPIFTVEFYRNEQQSMSSTNASSSQCQPSKSRAGNSPTSFAGKLNALLQLAVKFSDGHEIPDVLNLKAELMHSIKKPMTESQHLQAYEAVLHQYRRDKMASKNSGTDYSMYK